MKKTLAAVAVLAVAASSASAAIPNTWLHLTSHLPRTATVRLDGGPPVAVAGEGTTDVRLPMAALAGRHTLTVQQANGARYTVAVAFPPGRMAPYQGRRYWCVNLLAGSVQTYTHDECLMDVSDQG